MGILARLLIILAFGVAGAGVWATNFRDGGAGGPAPVRMVQVRVAAEPLRVGTFLNDTRAPLVETPEDQVVDGSVTAGDRDLIGAVIIDAVEPGEPVTRRSLLAPGQEGFLAAVLAPGRRAVSLAVDAVSGNAGHIFPGDRVDLLLTQELDIDGPSGRRWASETILQDVRVIAVDQRLGGDLLERGGGGDDDGPQVARTITLEVLPGGAEVIAVARNLGAISLTLRSLIVEGDEAALAREPTVVGPIYGADVSAVARAAAEDDAARREAPALTQPTQPVVVMRGGESDEVR